MLSFGSFATNLCVPSSDLDLVCLVREKTESMKKYKKKIDRIWKKYNCIEKWKKEREHIFSFFFFPLKSSSFYSLVIYLYLFFYQHAHLLFVHSLVCSNNKLKKNTFCFLFIFLVLHSSKQTFQKYIYQPTELGGFYSFYWTRTHACY